MIFTDHRPLISIFGKNSPKGVIGRWVLAIQEYNARLRYLPGKENTTADMLSRVPTEEILEDSVEWYIEESDELEESILLMGTVREGKEKSMPDLEKIRKAQKEDRHCREIMKRLLRGDERRNSEGMEGFKAVEGILYKVRLLKRVEGGHITVNFVIPESILDEILNWCHSGIGGEHQGSEKTLQIFRRYFWNK